MRYNDGGLLLALLSFELDVFKVRPNEHVALHDGREE